jgi:hypothetical protein
MISLIELAVGGGEVVPPEKEKEAGQVMWDSRAIRTALMHASHRAR